MNDSLLNLRALRGNTQCFSNVQYNGLLSKMKKRFHSKGSHLFWEGDPSNQLFYMYSGSVKLTKSTDEGKELVLYMYQPGDLIGEADAFYSAKHNFTAEVMEDSEIGAIEYKDVEMLICESSDFAIEFMKWMGIHHRLTQTKLRDLMMYGKPGALCSTLIRLGNTFGEKRGSDIYIQKKITHTDLSNMIGATRESVNRMLGDLRKKGALEYDHGYLIIKDHHMLREICHCEYCPHDVCRI
ncbi:CRP/FNR family transcriptional regulator [Paenibacillus shirakamiensis]|uniref:CRP/FNR family transcriptional regulator n=1 Tax=Paenibacillus shirakamiensis TaxID=1265935 RepID=A0ABS4JCF3_9BACL|nr:Crp/Fnr family transcriptional regulator [Paenibacillus shirakamiensis]MBP1999399.1 CRP/FNR family transcriptional regulator [Paenibacillus shirakamiensis]